LASEEVEVRAMPWANDALSFNLAFSQRPIIVRAHIPKRDDFAMHPRKGEWRIVNIEGEYLALLHFVSFRSENKIRHYCIPSSMIACSGCFQL
jgi:hypothetical protein